jgi:hypothetical protein
MKMAAVETTVDLFCQQCEAAGPADDWEVIAMCDAGTYYQQFGIRHLECSLLE